MKPSAAQNIAYVFELPLILPQTFYPNGGMSIEMQIVDCFTPWPDTDMLDIAPETWPEVVELIKPWLLKKPYVHPGRRYILITDFGESLIFGAS